MPGTVVSCRKGDHMRILVVSDSHGDTAALRRVLLAQPSAEVVFFLGDGERDIEAVRPDFPQKQFVCVSGNCDFAPLYPTQECRLLCVEKIIACHGHTFGVKGGWERYLAYARKTGADLALFGHTHQAVSERCGGCLLANPGELQGRTGRIGFGVLDTETRIINLHTLDFHAS